MSLRRRPRARLLRPGASRALSSPRRSASMTQSTTRRGKEGGGGGCEDAPLPPRLRSRALPSATRAARARHENTNLETTEGVIFSSSSSPSGPAGDPRPRAHLRAGGHRPAVPGDRPGGRGAAAAGAPRRRVAVPFPGHCITASTAPPRSALRLSLRFVVPCPVLAGALLRPAQRVEGFRLGPHGLPWQ